MVHVVIDREACVSCGSCYDICPEFFEENPGDSFSQVIEKYRIGQDPAEGKAPDTLEQCVIDSAEACPVQIIHIS
jgi:ferredoxin